MKFTVSSDRLCYIISFCIASAWFFSNVGRDSLPLGNVFTIFSIIISLAFFRASDLIILFVVGALIFLSSMPGAFNDQYFINFTYKILSFFPVIILILRSNIDSIYKAIFHSFTISTSLAILLLLLGFSSPKFIIYEDSIPRFAGLAIEPVSYALGAVVLYVFFLLRNPILSYSNLILFYIPILFAVSGIIIIKVLIDFFKYIKIDVKQLIIGIPLIFIIFYFLINETRAGESIDMRIYLYGEILKYANISFWGSGFYTHEDAKGLPGIARIFFELGLPFLVFLFFYYIIMIVKNRVFRNPFLLMGLVLPFITEAYGAPLLWLVSMYCLHRGNESN